MKRNRVIKNSRAALYSCLIWEKENKNKTEALTLYRSIKCYSVHENTESNETAPRGNNPLSKPHRDISHGLRDKGIPISPKASRCLGG
jgi:hypothetical protein